MRAMTYSRYGGPEVLQRGDLPRPTPAPGQVVLRVAACVVTSGDWRLMTADPWAVRLYQGIGRIRRPVLGHGMSGTVVEVGAGVDRWRVGQPVFGESPDAGGFAEFAVVGEELLAEKPDAASHGEAACTPVAGYTALQGLRDHGRLKSGGRVLIVGAAGGVGSTAVPLAKLLGAHVTAVASGGHESFVRDLGADEFIDYRDPDPVAGDLTRVGERWDVILDLVGRAPISGCKRALTPGGRYVAVSGALRRTAWLSLTGGPRMTGMIAKPDAGDLAWLAERLTSRELVPSIERSYPLEQLPEAIGRLGRGGIRGKLLIEPQSP